MILENFKKAVLSLCILSVGVSHVANANMMGSKDEDVQVVAKTYEWLNHISSTNRPAFTAEEVARYFDRNAKMVTNSKLVCEGVEGHFEHFNELNAYYKSLQVDMKKIDYRKSGDRVYLHYQIKGKDLKDASVTIDVMGYIVIQNHKIALFNEVVSHSS